MKRVTLFSLFVFSMFVVFSCSDDNKKDEGDQVIDNRLPASEVICLTRMVTLSVYLTGKSKRIVNWP